MRHTGGKRSLKPLELLSEFSSFRESIRGFNSTLVSELWYLLKEVLDQIDINMTPDFKISTRKCRKEAILSSLLQCNISVNNITMQDILENVIKNKLECGSRNKKRRFAILDFVGFH